MLGVNLGTLYAVLKLDKSGFDASLKAVSSAMGRMTSALTNQARIWTRRATLAMTAYVGASIKAFASFEEELANVSTMLDEQSMRMMPAYEKALKSMAVQFGESTATLSKGLYDILSASVAPEKALNVLAVSAKAARAGMTDTGIAADAITTILNSYGIAAEEAASVSDFLFAVVKRGKTTFAELAPNIGKVAAIASTAGLSLEEMGAAIATMTRAGLKTPIAITSLRATLNSFLKPSEDGAKAARELGFELNTATLRAIGFDGVLRKMKNATAEQIAAIVPSSRAIAGFAAALKNASGYAYDLNFMMNRAGLAGQAYAKMTDTVAYSLRQLWQALKIISVNVGSRFAQDIKDLSKYLVDNMDTISDWAEYFADRIVFLKNVFVEFVKYMKNDFGGGMGEVFDTFLSGLQATAKIAIKLSYAAGKGIWKGIKEALLGDDFVSQVKRQTAKQYESLGLGYKQEVLKERGGRLISLHGPQVATVPEDKAEWHRIYKQVYAYMEEQKEKELYSSVAGFQEKAGQIIRDAMANTKTSNLITSITEGPLADLRNKDFFRELSIQFRKAKNEINDHKESFMSMLTPVTSKYHELTKAVFGTGEAIKKTTDEIAEHSKKLDENQEKVYDMVKQLDIEYEMLGRTDDEREHAIDLLKFQNAAAKAFGKDSVEYLQLQYMYAEKLNRLYEGRRGFSAFQTTIKKWGDEVTNTWQNLANITVQAFDRMGDALANFVMEGKANMKDLARSFISDIITMMSKAMMFNTITGIFPSLAMGAGAAAVNVATPSPATTLAPAAETWLDTPATFGDGGIVTKPQMAVVGEKGPEAIIPLNQLNRSQNRTPNVSVKVENKGTPQKFDIRQALYTNKGIILDIVSTDMTSDGITAKSSKEVR